MPPTGSGPATGPSGSGASGGKRRLRAVPALVAAALVIAAAGGVGFGHIFWPGTQTASGNPIEMSTGSGSGGSTGGSGSAGSNQNGTGNGGNGNGGSSSNSDGGGTTGGSGSSGNGNNGNTNNGNGNSGNGGSDNGNGIWPGDPFPNGLLPGGFGPGGSGNSQTQQPGTITSAQGAPDDISGILDKVDDAVVDINVTFTYQQAEGAGTGIVLTSTGEVLTNNHVIDGATSISVTDIGNGKTYRASVVGYDKTHDVAVLQLKDASGLATATIAGAGSLAVGDGIVGIGNAGGAGGEPSAAGGSVTALNKTISVGDEMYGTTTTLSGLIEVNADIQSGDSGGPLVDQDGAVVGMNTAASAQPARDGSSDGYAIPIARAMRIVKTIESGTGTSTVHVGATAALGVLISTGDQSSTGVQPGRLGNGQQTTARGALVAGVIDGGAAAKAGLVEGDVITSLGGHRITSSDQLSTLMGGYRPGQSVTLGWTTTDGQSHTATITLGTGPAA
jgi:S1-C subfamily serine protease